MGKYDGFMDGIGRKGRAARRQKASDNERNSNKSSERIDSAEEQKRYVERIVQPVQEYASKPDIKKTKVQMNPDYTYYFSFVLDATADVAKIYPRIYAMLLRVVEKLEATRESRSSQRRKINMKIGVTTFHDKVSGDADMFGDAFFTDDFGKSIKPQNRKTTKPQFVEQASRPSRCHARLA